MLSERALEEALARVGLSAPVRFDEVTRSTQATALELAEAGAPEWTLVAANHQTAGRGRLGREWVDTPGEALLFSTVLRPDLLPERVGLLSLLAGLAMCLACRESSGADVGCKWPNDLLVDGRKVGGILAESKVLDGSLAHVVIGIGVNLAGSPSGVPDAAPIGSIASAALLTAFLRAFRERYPPAGPAFAIDVLAAYRDVCATLGARIRATTVDGRIVEGRAVDLDERGGLIVETHAGREAVAFGEVVHLGE